MNYKVPYDFILQLLYPIRPTIKKMFGCYGLYHNKRLLFLLREREERIEFNGVFIATQPQYFDALENEIHISRMEFDLDGTAHSWLFLSEDLADFDEKIALTCNMVKAGDERIGQ